MEATILSNQRLRKNVLGNRVDGKAYVVTHAGCSSDLLGKSTRRRDLTAQFLHSIARVLCEVPALSILLHWAHGPVEDEVFETRDRRRVTLDEFLSIFPDLDDDVRYILIPERAGE
jgi:hypothetical protein